LHIWARNTGKRIAVKVPPGRYLLVQAGKQIEHLTGGLIKAGLHEVVVNSSTLEVIEKRKVENPDRPLIRISSTFFWHLNSDFDLEPIPELKARVERMGEEVGTYPKMKVGDQVSM
jgi:isopenicillin N synthase-like dioxygenase